MTVKSEPAFPSALGEGLTKREFFAGLALAGLLADSIPRQQAAPFAVVAADALIDELNGVVKP